MNAENYYVENKKGCFAIVKAKLIELVKGKKRRKRARCLYPSNAPRRKLGQND